MVIAFLSGFGCRPFAHPRSLDPEKPMEWILVERAYSEILDPPMAGAARIEPEALALVLQPTFGNVDRVCFHTLRVLCSRPGPLDVGDTVDVEVSVEGNVGHEHVLDVAPTRPGVRLLSPSPWVVKPGTNETVRFTADSAGEGGIEIRIRECRRLE